MLAWLTQGQQRRRGEASDAAPSGPASEEQQAVPRSTVSPARDQAEAANAAYHRAMLDPRDSDVALHRLAKALGVTRQNVGTLVKKWRK